MRIACTAALLTLLMAWPGYSSAATERLPPAAKIAGVAVGGLGPYGARVELERQLRPTYESAVNVRFHGRRRIAVPTQRLGLEIHYREMVDAAYAQVARGLHIHVQLRRTVDRSRLRAAT